MQRTGKIMENRSFALGNGQYASGPDMRPGSPVPFYMRTLAFLDAKSASTTFWDLL